MDELIRNIREITSTIEPLWTIALVPVWQEVLFRYLPYKYFYSPKGNFWLVGIVSSLIFASIHWYFGLLFVIYSFIGGMVLWWVITRYGLLAAIILHAILNMTDLSLGLREYLL